MEEEEDEEEEEEEEEEVVASGSRKPASTKKTTPKARSVSEERIIPKDKHKLDLKHLLHGKYLSPGDEVYVLQHLESPHGTILENGKIMVDKNFTTTKDPTAPKEYLYHVIPKKSKLREARQTQHWQNVYVRLNQVDGGVRQMLELRNALFSGKPVPPPLDKKVAPLPKSLTGGSKSAAAGPSKSKKVEIIPSTEEEEDEEEDEDDEESASEEESEEEIDEIVLDDEDEEEEEEEEEELPRSTSGRPGNGNNASLKLPARSHKIELKHLIQLDLLAPGDDVYVLEHLESRHGTVMEDGSIMVDKKFTTSKKPAAPKEYLLHVVPKDSELRKVKKTQHYHNVYARLAVDCGVRQLQVLKDAALNGQPLPPPLAKRDAPLPRSLGGTVAAVPSKKQQQVKEPSIEEDDSGEDEEDEDESDGAESDDEVVLPKKKDRTMYQVEDDIKDEEMEEEDDEEDQEPTDDDSVLASQFFGPSEDEEEAPVSEKKASRLVKQEPAATPKSARPASPLMQKKRPASAAAEKPPQPKKQNKAAATKQVADLLKDLAEDSDFEGLPSGPALSPLRAQKKLQTKPKFAHKSVIEKAPTSPSSSSSPSSSLSPPPRQVAVKPLSKTATTASTAATAALASKSSLLPRPSTLPYLPSMEEKKVWCLDNVPQWVLAPALQKALLAEIPTGIINVDVPLVALDNGRISHPGYAVIRFSTANLAEKAEPVLRQLCIRTSACGIPRPLILRRPWLTKDYPWGKQNLLPGHLPLRMQEPPPPHYAQPNTVEFEMAVHWTQLERAISTARNNLHKEQAYELARVMSHYLQHQVNYHGEIDETALHGPPPPPPAPGTSSSPTQPARGSSYLWICGVSPTLKVETLKEVFAHHGYPQRAEMLRDKVTKQVNGTAVIQMESADRARKIARNMQDMEFMLGGSPRPLQVEVAKPGGPRGSQSVFDRALRAVVGKHDFEATTLQLIRIPEVIKETASFEHRAAGCLRQLMMTHRTEQDAARQVAREARAVLAQEQIEQFSVESEKMNRLKALHDGQAYKKMCDLHNLAIKRLRHSSPTHLLPGFGDA